MGQPGAIDFWLPLEKKYGDLGRDEKKKIFCTSLHFISDRNKLPNKKSSRCHVALGRDGNQSKEDMMDWLGICLSLQHATKDHSLRTVVYIDWLIDFIVLNTTFSNISAISWRQILVVEEAGVPGENHRPWTSNW